MNKKVVLFSILAVLLSCALLFLGFTPASSLTPQQVYRVYLAGESIGLIHSKEELEQYIDREQSHLKETYGVDKVYAPRDLDIVEEITYDEKTSSAAEIYNRIKDRSPFTIEGYKIVIHGVEEMQEEGGSITTPDQTIYVLDKNVYINAVYNIAQAFIDEDELKAYETSTQSPIIDTGKLIENVYIQNEEVITEENIPVDEKIYTSVDELSKYLMFGTLEDQQTYTVQVGDTISDVAFNNQISPEEFLIANTSFKSADDLLYPGQQVVLGILQPQLKIVEENHTVERQTIPYETTYQNDDSQYVGYEKVIQEGTDGVQLITTKNKLVNGEIREMVVTERVVEKPAVNRVVVRGTRQRQVSSGGFENADFNVEVPVALGSWVWPTRSPYMITSSYGWRWGKLHKGIDISGTGEGSPIMAANNGIVVTSDYTSTNGHYILIKHANGYFTEYAHMRNRYVSVGDIVYAGDIIGTMGHTGYAFGTHLHFGLWNGTPYITGSLNPLSLY